MASPYHRTNLVRLCPSMDHQLTPMDLSMRPKLQSDSVQDLTTPMTRKTRILCSVRAETLATKKTNSLVKYASDFSLHCAMNKSCITTKICKRWKSECDLHSKSIKDITEKSTSHASLSFGWLRAYTENDDDDEESTDEQEEDSDHLNASNAYDSYVSYEAVSDDEEENENRENFGVPYDRSSHSRQVNERSALDLSGYTRDNLNEQLRLYRQYCDLLLRQQQTQDALRLAQARLTPRFGQLSTHSENALESQPLTAMRSALLARRRDVQEPSGAVFNFATLSDGDTQSAFTSTFSEYHKYGKNSSGSSVCSSRSASLSHTSCLNRPPLVMTEHGACANGDTFTGYLSERKRIVRPLTGRHVRHGTGASPSTLASLRAMLQERKKMRDLAQSEVQVDAKKARKKRK